MSFVHRLKSVHKIPADIETVWKYFSDPRNLLSITPSSLNLKMSGELFGEEVYPGQVMTYVVKPVMGIPLSWMTEITHVEPLKMFVDDQRKGPYKLWHHQHHFKPIDGGVEMTDLVHYRLPLGFLGALSHGIVVKPKLEEIFSFRFNRINELFGSWPDQQMNLSID